MKDILYDKPRGPLANCLALHDFGNKTPDVKDWLEHTLDFFKSYGLKPNRLSPYSEKSRKNVGFDRGIKSFYKNNFNDITDVWFSQRVHEDAYDDDAYFEVWLSIRPYKINHTLVIAVDNNIMELNSTEIDRLTIEMARYFSPRYGYVYQRSYAKGPASYPSGICANLDWGDPECDLITKWSNEYHMSDGDYKSGDLRDIYPMNLLSQAHQEHRVGGKPFFEWIEERPSHGTLTPLDESLWAWWVREQDIPAVRETLRSLGWVIAI